MKTENREKYQTDGFAYVVLTLATLFFATNHVIGRGVHAEMPPVGLSFWRWLAAAFMLLPFIYRDLLASKAIISSHLRTFIFLGCIMIGSTTLVLLALNYTTAINAALINSTQPVLTVLLAAFIIRDKLAGSQLLGIACGLLGVLIMISHAELNFISTVQLNIGDLIALLAIAGYAIYAINIRKIPAALSASVSLFMIIVCGCLGLLPFYLLESLYVRSFPLHTNSLITIIALALTTSLFGMLAWNAGNRIIGPARAGMFINLTPVFTVVLAMFFLGEEFHLYHLGGAALISAGIFLVLRK